MAVISLLQSTFLEHLSSSQVLPGTLETGWTRMSVCAPRRAVSKALLHDAMEAPGYGMAHLSPL